MKSISRLTLAVTLLTAPVLTAPVCRRSAWYDQTWDYIVVGAGPAGIIAADRLSETGKKTLLLEQGGPSYGITGGIEKPDWLQGTNLSRVDVPGLYSTIFGEASDTLMCGSKINAYGACTIGGNSAINAGLYFQPPASDWDTFHPDGWHSADVAPAVSRLLARQGSFSTTSQNNQRYLQSGYDAARSWLVDGAGYNNVDVNDVADQKYQVFGRTEYNYIDGQRGGPVRTYLQTALTRPNFHFESQVQVQHVVRSGSKASGVLATVGGQDKTIRLCTTGRVILSGGALLSPQLLMFSGIGDSATLSRLQGAGKLDANLPESQWVTNNAVGNGLFDNPNTFIELESPTVESYTYVYNNPPQEDQDLYLNSRSGPYAFGGQTSVFWSYINHTDGTPPSGLQGTINTNGYGDWANSATAITLNVYGTSGLLSKGQVELNNEFAPGPSSSVYLSDPRDAQDIAQFIYDIFQALPRSNSGLVPRNIAQNATVEEIRQYISTKSDYAVGQVNHYSSSCRIGSCVDTNTQVIGTDNIHVVDASIVMPLTVNPQFGVMVAAERASELIAKLT